MARTLVFCTSYAGSVPAWTTRYRLWLNFIRASEIAHDHVLIVDDGSPLLPEWSDTRTSHSLQEAPGSAAVTLFHFDQRLGRQARAVYPGWYRSFCFAARFADAYGFEKVIHIESDGFIISRRMQHYINEVSDGWIAPTIQSHAMPESAIQIMAGGGLRSYIEFARSPYSSSVGFEAENVLPFTHIESGFIGSRYGETMAYVPREADFVTQTNPAYSGRRDYYWWVDPAIFPADPIR
jgi:hypothetical protein